MTLKFEKVLIATVASLAVLTSPAEYLYWQIAPTFGAMSSVSSVTTEAKLPTVQASELGDGYSYFVEMYNAENTGASPMYTGLYGAGVVAPKALSAMPMLQLSSSPNTAPEPTSAVMMLLGLTALALRRRKA